MAGDIKDALAPDNGHMEWGGQRLVPDLPNKGEKRDLRGYKSSPACDGHGRPPQRYCPRRDNY